MTMNEKRQKKYPDTNAFHYYNANPKNKVTCDCVVRALSVALNQSYEDTYKELFEFSLKNGYMINDPKNEERYLKSKGWHRCKMPKHSDNTKYTGIEFCEQIAEYGKRYYLNIGHNHVVAVVNAKIYDIWNSSYNRVGVYYEK